MKIAYVILIPVIAAILVPIATAYGSNDLWLTKMKEIKGKAAPPAAAIEYPPAKCGTPVTVAAFAVQSRAKSDSLEVLFQRPTGLPNTFGTTHFIMHYTTVGPDSVYQSSVDSLPGVPLYVARMASYFEYAWSIEINTLGYGAPPQDNGQGGDNRYDVYIHNLGFGIFGATSPESLVPPSQIRAFSYIEIENDFAESQIYRFNPWPAAQVTSAHEFFHAVQFGYDVTEYDMVNPNDPTTYKPWWMEATSTWMEDVVWDPVDDYFYYLPFFFKYIYMGLGTFSYIGDVRSFHPYASCIWPIFLTTRYQSVNIVKQIWQICGQAPGYNTLPATNTVLGSYGTTLSGAFLEFSIWNFHTGAFADTVHYYPEGQFYPAAESSTFISNLTLNPSYSIRELPGDTMPPEDLGANFVILQSHPNRPGGASFNLTAQTITNAEWHFALMGYNPANSQWDLIAINPGGGSSNFQWYGWDRYQAIVLVPTVSGLSASYISYYYSGTVNFDSTLTNLAEQAPALPEKLGSRCYPNPFNARIIIEYSLPADSPVMIEIYDLLGRRIAILDDSRQAAGPHQVIWDATEMTSGIYYYKIKADDLAEVGKMTMIK